jgi:hypothetical protein
MLPVIILVAIAVPVLIVAFTAVSRRKAAGEQATPEGQPNAAATQSEYEPEFEAAEAYQEQWRDEQHREHPDDRLY